MHHLCKSQHDFRLTERDFQQFHHLIIGQFSRTDQKTDLAYLRNEKAKAEQKLRSCQHREKILERQMSELNRRERVHRLCTRAGMLESFLVCPGELTDNQVMELLKISFRQPKVVLALAKMVHDVHERSNVQNPLE